MSIQNQRVNQNQNQQDFRNYTEHKGDLCGGSQVLLPKRVYSFLGAVNEATRRGKVFIREGDTNYYLKYSRNEYRYVCDSIELQRVHQISRNLKCYIIHYN